MNKIITLVNRKLFNTAAPESTFKETGLFKIGVDCVEENQKFSDTTILTAVRTFISGEIYNVFDPNNDGEHEDEAMEMD